MTDYKEQANSLREHADLIETSIELYGPSATRLLVYDLRNAAAAIEDLQAQLPKRGEWVEENRRPRSSQFVCSECHRTAYDPQPTRDKAWKKRCRYAYCPNCGAKMFASDTNVPNKHDTTDGPIITPCRGCSDYDGYGGCKSKGGCARAKMEVQDEGAGSL